MNIFYIDKNPKVIAKAMTDKHIVKMVLETAQILCSVHRSLYGDNVDEKLYKLTHKNHPSVIWARESKENYEWLYNLFERLSMEYSNRYNRVHKSWETLADPLWEIPFALEDKEGFTEPPQVMPDIYKEESTINAYRKYYLAEKIKEEKDLERYKRIIT